METSTVKVRRTIGQLAEALPQLAGELGGMQAIMLAPVVSFAPQLVEMILERLPDDPAELDALLDTAAATLAALRSDAPADADDDDAQELADDASAAGYVQPAPFIERDGKALAEHTPSPLGEVA